MKFYFILKNNKESEHTQGRIFIINNIDIICFDLTEISKNNFAFRKIILENNEYITSVVNKSKLEINSKNKNEFINNWFKEKSINNKIDFKNRFSYLEFINNEPKLKTPYIKDEDILFEYYGYYKSYSDLTI